MSAKSIYFVKNDFIMFFRFGGDGYNSCPGGQHLLSVLKVDIKNMKELLRLK